MARARTLLVRTCIGALAAGAAPALGAPFGDAPPNDDCADASPIGDDTIRFSNLAATTDGFAPPCDLQMGSDIWYDYVASCTGTWLVGTCGSDFDTVLAAYDGKGCPVGVALDCDDDSASCGDGLQSQITVPVISGNTYKLQVGGFKGNQGSGFIASSCGIVQCPWDVDGGGRVGITDLLELLAAWGNNPGHPADFDADGMVGITDLLALLAHWGPCG